MKESTTRIEPMTIGKWTPDIDPTGWTVQEKYDGVRALWDGSSYYSREGRTINVPTWLERDMPGTMLDGELWLGRGRRAELVGLINQGTAGHHDRRWTEVGYMVFDMPDDQWPWLVRSDSLSTVNLPHHAIHAWSRRLQSERDMRGVLAVVCSEGGEGLVLRHPRGHYRSGKSSTTLKLKPHYL